MDEASVEKIIMDISDIAFALIEAANGKWMNFSDASIIRAACWSTFRPFIHKLYEEKKTHDFENNPTFMDLFDVLQKRQAEDYLIDSLMKTLQEIKTPDNDVLAGRISNYLEECRNGSLKIICEIEDILSALKGYCHKTNIPEKQLIQISWQRSLARFWKVSYAVCSHFAKIHALANFYKTKNKLWVYASCADTIYSSDNSCAINELTELKRACISSENIFTAQVVEIEDIRKCGKGRAVFDYATFHLLLRPTVKDKEFLLENLKLPDLAVDSLADMQYGIILYKGNAVSLNLASGIKSINGSKEAFNL